MGSNSDIVVSGIGGMYPKCFNFDDFIDLLIQNKSAAEEAKWIKNGKGNTFYNNFPEKRHNHFDGSFFGVVRSQTIYFDPLTRLLMEASFEAVIDAGLNPIDLSGRTIPVIFASSISENNSNLYESEGPGYGITGQARCMMSNRVSYFFNLKGPSISLDANWAGGLQTITDAIRMIDEGLCEAAIVGATNLSVGPAIQQLMESRGLICKDGKTKPYTEQADGYTRGDGVVVLFIQRADSAKRIYCSLLYADLYFNGDRKQDYSNFNKECLAQFLQECYDKSGIDPNDVSYLETNGCGLKEIDNIELAAVEKVFCKNRKSPLKIGSVKTNIGHTEPVAALFGLLKIIAGMETGIIPAHLNFDIKDTKIPALVNGKIEVVNRNQEWTGDIAAINCIGFVSLYGHLIVRRNLNNRPNPTTDLPILTYYSTRTEEGVQKINQKVLAQSPDLNYNKLVQEVYSNQIFGHLYRGYVLKASKDVQGFKHSTGVKPPIWYIYSGMGSQWKTMGRDLLKIPVFAKAVTNCHNILKPKGIDLLRVITEDDPQIFENILNSFVGIAAVQIGLTDVLESIGIVPDGVVGHSVGELGCAYADKCLTAEQMILSAYYRGKASMDAKLIVGMMAAVGLGHSAVKRMCPDAIEIACHNSADSCTISGPAEDVKKFVDVLQSTGIFARLVNVSNIAYHSRYIKPAAPLLLSSLKEMIPHPKERSKKWISTSVPQESWNSDLAKTASAEYLTNNLLSSVLLEECLPLIPKNAVLIEVAPHGLLQAILKRALPKEVVNVALTKRETNCLEFLFSAFGELYISGIDINVGPLYPDVSLPVRRGTRSLTNLMQWEHEYEWVLTAFDTKLETNEKSFMANSKEIINLTKNRINNRIMLPFSVYFGYICDVINKDGDVKMITIEEIIFENHIEMDPEDSVLITVMYQPGSGHFEVHAQPKNKATNQTKVVLTGTAIVNEKISLPPANIENNKEISVIRKSDFYKELNIKGYDFSEENKLVSAVTLRQNGFTATLDHSEDLKACLSSTLQMHLFSKNQKSQQILLPKYIRRIDVQLADFKKLAQEAYTVSFNEITDIIESSCGLHITGIEYETTESNSVPVQIENLKFAVHFEENIQDITDGFNMLSKIITENIPHEIFSIVELKEKHSPKYLPYIENYLKKKKILAKTNEIYDLNLTALQNSSLTIISGQFLKTIKDILSKVNSYILLCFDNTQTICTSKNYITVAQFSTKSSKFYLIKKADFTPVKVINIKKEKVSYKNVQDVLWTAELKAAVHDAKRLYVVCRSVPVEGIGEFVGKMQNLAYGGHKFRFLFLLDAAAPECESGSHFYARIFQQDLIVQVLKNGSWGDFINAGEVLEKNVNKSIVNCAISSRDLLNLCKPEYFGLHLNDLTRTNSDSIPCEVGALDFAGTNKKGQRIMGFGQFDSEQGLLRTDSEFVWTVPKNWTLCDAVTVPYAYTLAYYALSVVADRTAGDSILVHGGATEVGFAALYIAYNLGHTVYTTVETSVQRNYIKKFMSRLDDTNILDSSSTDYVETINTLTRGRGVEIILNSLSGIDHFEACKEVLGTYGRFIQLGFADMNRNNTTGMFIFNSCTSFYGITGQRLLELPQDVKHQLQEMVTDGINKNLIGPMSRKVLEENEVEDGLRYLRSSNSHGAVVTKVNDLNHEKLELDKRSPRVIQSQGSYLIYADSSDTWLFLIDWLVKNGAKRIIIANLLGQKHDFVKRHISIIKQNYDADIIISKHNAHTFENAKNLINDVCTNGVLDESFIFTSSDDTDNKEIVVENIDKALSQIEQKGRIVCLSGRNKEKSYIRKSGLAICNIAWNSAYTPQAVFKNLDMILKKNLTNIYLKDDAAEKESKTDLSNAEDLTGFLPSSLKILKQLSRCQLKSPNIIKLASNNPLPDYDVPPVFLVPSLSGPYSPHLRKFAAQLMYPVFSVSLPATGIKDDIVDILAEQIISVDSPLVYRLIGLSWGGILALEIAKKLETLGKNVELYLIDGAPQIIRSYTKDFNSNGEFNLTLLKEATKIDGESIKHMLQLSDISKNDYKDIVRSLTVLKNHIEYSNYYKPLQNKIRGQVIVILPETTSDENISLTEHSEQFRYHEVKANSTNILENKNLIEFLHENISM